MKTLAERADLAVLYSVSEQTITRIRDRKTWAWLVEEVGNTLLDELKPCTAHKKEK